MAGEKHTIILIALTLPNSTEPLIVLGKHTFFLSPVTFSIPKVTISSLLLLHKFPKSSPSLSADDFVSYFTEKTEITRREFSTFNSHIYTCLRYSAFFTIILDEFPALLANIYYAFV